MTQGGTLTQGADRGDRALDVSEPSMELLVLWVSHVDAATGLAILTHLVIFSLLRECIFVMISCWRNKGHWAPPPPALGYNCSLLTTTCLALVTFSTIVYSY